MRIEGCVAVVAGGASGLGEATTRRLAKSGASVVVLDRDASKGQTLVDALGGQARFQPVDVTDAAAVDAAVLEAASGGELRAAVTTAGISAGARLVGRDGSPHSADIFRHVYEVNVLGTFNVLRSAASAMAGNEPIGEDDERGVVITTSSTAAYEGQIGALAYAASKAAIVGMTLPASRDLVSRHIRVVCIAPGAFTTPMTQGDISDERRDAFADQHLFPRRMGRPDEFAALVEHIITNPYLNGETIRLDAGIRVPPR